MKTGRVVTMLILAIAGLTACEKDLHDPNQSSEPTVKDLIIPADFDWKLLKTASCNITAAQAVYANIYSNDSYSEKNLLAVVPIKAGSNLTLPLSVTKNAQNVYIRYEDATGIQNTLVAPVGTDGKIKIAIPGTSTRAVTSGKEFIDGRKIILYYPNGDFGTVLFEDNYPTLGDYDLNDFVIQYQFLIEADPQVPGKIDHITLIMEVKAIGADQKIQYYIPHLKLSVPPTTVDNIKVSERGTSTNSPINVVDVTRQSIKNNYLILKFDGAEKSENKNQESIYLNTKSGCTTPTRTFIVDIAFKQAANGNFADLRYIDADGFDIFLANADGSKEIHLPEFGSVFNDKVTEYKDENNFVWGLNIPSPMGHAIEKANFLKAYPKFADWVTGIDSSGLWYKNGNSTYLFNYN